MYHTCDINYYKSAIGYMQQFFPEADFYFFSDDHDWLVKHLIPESKNFFTFPNDESDHAIDDFILMKECNHHIIANSTYSWWAASLNSFHEKKVVAPKKWFSNSNESIYLPENWVQI